MQLQARQSVTTILNTILTSHSVPSPYDSSRVVTDLIGPSTSLGAGGQSGSDIRFFSNETSQHQGVRFCIYGNRAVLIVGLDGGQPFNNIGGLVYSRSSCSAALRSN